MNEYCCIQSSFIARPVNSQWNEIWIFMVLQTKRQTFCNLCSLKLNLWLHIITTTLANYSVRMELLTNAQLLALDIHTHQPNQPSFPFISGTRKEALGIREGDALMTRQVAHYPLLLVCPLSIVVRKEFQSIHQNRRGRANCSSF